jgi:bifunctional UDP-N-acetylglucosamine pyrophosphorylase/glucosamine-1-phosphate N-acetyltransferase
MRAVVLAAGKGTRMKSARPKVLHPICGRAMLWYVIRSLRDAGVAEVLVVTSAQVAEELPEIARDAALENVGSVLQEPQLGTGHAVQTALAKLAPRDGTILVLNGDLPLVEAELIKRTVDAARDAALALVTARMPLPSSLGRVVRDGDRVTRIVEARDATAGELDLDEMNAGLYAFDEAKLRRAIAELRNDNAQGEYYLTDTIARLAGSDRVVGVLADNFLSVLGVNDRSELASARALLNARICEHHMCAGVTIVDPSTTYLEPDLEIAPDTTILPGTTIGKRSKIGPHAEIGPYCRIVNSKIGEHAVVTESVVTDSTIGDFVYVGPWAHIRGGSELGTGVRIGDFVELKNAKLAAGVRAAHLSYIGDASVGERTNVGAGTITCNYDGVKKNATTIGKDVFIGSDTAIVAPVEIGDGAMTGAGSVVIRDVPAGTRVAGNPAKQLPDKT